MDKIMELNKETALRLWNEQFGSQQKAFDFAGREIAKAAYNNRNSKFGWNVDHILPQSRGGKTADHNLICCHILTNDEKADKFPCFKANDKEFEIQKRQNHYEIIPKSDKKDHADKQGRDQSGKGKREKNVNLFDAARGLKHWRSYKREEKDIFVGYVKVEVFQHSNDYGLLFSNTEKAKSEDFMERYLHFLKTVFDTECIFLKKDHYFGEYRYVFTVVNEHVDTKEETEALLDKCILLNTYSSYFVSQKLCSRQIRIVFELKCYENEMDKIQKMREDIQSDYKGLGCSLVINDLVRINTSAKEKIHNNGYEHFEYNYVFTKLQEDLNKQD
jgi:hypothetical protein